MSKSEFYKGRDADQIAQLSKWLKTESASEARDGPPKKRRKKKKTKTESNVDWKAIKEQTEWITLLTFDPVASKTLRLNPIICEFYPNEASN